MYWPSFTDDVRSAEHVIPGLSKELVNLVGGGEIDMAAIIRPPFSLQSDLRWTILSLESYRLIVPHDVQGVDWSELIPGSHSFVTTGHPSVVGR